MKKRIIFLSALLLTPFSGIATAQNPAALVDGVKIDESAVLERMTEKHYSNTLNELINETLLMSEAGKLGVEVSQKEIKEKMEAIKSQYLGEDDFRNKTGLSDEELREKVKKDLLIRKTVIKARNIKFTKKQLEQFFEKNREKFQESKSVKIRQLFVKTEQEARDAHTALKAGANFAKLTSLKSTDENLKKTGGDLGYIKKGALIKQIEDIVFNLEKGEFTTPININNGYTILKVEDIKEPKEVKFKDIKDDLEQLLVNQAVADNLNDYILELRRKAEIRVFSSDNAPAILPNAGELLKDLPDKARGEFIGGLLLVDGIVVSVYTAPLKENLPPGKINGIMKVFSASKKSPEKRKKAPRPIVKLSELLKAIPPDVRNDFYDKMIFADGRLVSFYTGGLKKVLSGPALKEIVSALAPDPENLPENLKTLCGDGVCYEAVCGGKPGKRYCIDFKDYNCSVDCYGLDD